MRSGILIFVVAMDLGAQSAADVQWFETKVRPVLARNCYSCHGVDKQTSNLRLDSRQAMLQGGKRSAAIVPGKDGDSLLMRAIRQDGDLKMPLGGRLKDTEIEAIAEWIRKGAAWPASAPVTSSIKDRYNRLVRGHFAFQPVKAASYSGHPVDFFVRARLARDGLRPAAAADKRILIRRLSYVLTGLPPRPDEIAQFVADPSPNAYEKLVDRLLGSPHFGEQWARHWLDLVRYGETRGYEWNYEILGAWRYRDYLIRAFNADVAYDQLVREHIAGDLLAKPRIDAANAINESVIGTAFYRLGEAGHDDCIQFREIALDVIDNQIDTLTKTFQGLTVSCARCHDHKLDPIPAEDYYGLYGVLNSSRQVTQTIDSPQANAARIGELRAIKADIRRDLSDLWRRDVGSIAQALTGAKAEGPAQVYAAFGKEPWTRIVSHYRTEAESHAGYNRANFQPLPLNEWKASGMGLREGIARAGDFAVSTEGETVLKGVYPQGIYTNLDSSRLNGALRLPELPPGKKYVSILAMGGILGSHRVIVDNCAIGEGNKVLDSDQLAWHKTQLKNANGLPVYLELITRFDNPRIPDRPGVLKEPQLKLMEVPRSFFGITQAVTHDVDAAPQEDLSYLLPLLEGGEPRDEQELIARYQAIASAAVERWSRSEATNADTRWIDWLMRKGVLTNSGKATPRLQQLVAAYRAAEAHVEPPRVVEGMTDIGAGRDFPILIGGSPLNPGAPASRAFLRYLFGDTPLTTQGSGRRELAERIADPANPLTARVMVNRIWHYVFGRGIVSSVDNFGLLAERPSHPELLDTLAARFVADGWSIRKMIRLLVTSEAFRQSGDASIRAKETDPENILLQHYPLRRLAAEELRDSVLMAAGTLKSELYGTSVDPYREKPQDYRRLFSGALDGGGRRSLYVKVTRMEGARFLETFDYPAPMVTRGARDVTNVPAQALTLMNDPFVTAQAAKLAARVMEAGESFDDRLNALFRFTLGRVPDAVERERFRGLAGELRSLGGETSTGESWTHLAHAALNLKEFLYIQ